MMKWLIAFFKRLPALSRWEAPWMSTVSLMNECIEPSSPVFHLKVPHPPTRRIQLKLAFRSTNGIGTIYKDEGEKKQWRNSFFLSIKGNLHIQLCVKHRTHTDTPSTTLLSESSGIMGRIKGARGTWPRLTLRWTSWSTLFHHYYTKSLFQNIDCTWFTKHVMKKTLDIFSMIIVTAIV